MIRKANKNDLNCIIELNNKLFELESGRFDEDKLISNWALSECSKDYFLELIDNGFVYIFEEDNKILAYLAGSIEKVSYEKNKYAQVNNMYVDERLRGKGIGRNLIEFFIVDMKNKNIKDIRVTASYKNIDAREFYKKVGFKEFEITHRMEI